jgi:7,8-dihydropterin-6-yl-methyl-4-(beta-D-ribofuranosyl)aminobenzene 5'-phosphate synthase
MRREARTRFSFPADRLGETRSLEILPLYEAAGAQGLRVGKGASYRVRTDHATILFDLGDNPSAESPSPLRANMERLGVSLKEFDRLVLSHRHPDHVGGRRWWDLRSFSTDGASRPGLGGLAVVAPEKVLYPGASVTIADGPASVAEGVATTGPFTFYEPYPVWEILPRDREQALAVRVAGLGIVLIVGCGHMGLKTLLDRADSVFGIPVAGLVGGLHYGGLAADALGDEIRMLKERGLRLIALSPHDSGPRALDAFAAAFPDSFRTLRVGEAVRVSGPSGP